MPRTLYGVIHLPALPGSPAAAESLDAIEALALADAAAYREAGWQGLVLENFGDAPFFPGRVGAETVAAMARIARSLRLAEPDLLLGVNVLRNDGESALAVAAAAGADFIRVNVLCGVSLSDQGILEGRAAQILRLRRGLGSGVKIFADVDVKHARMGAHRDAVEQAEDLIGRAGAEALIVSGRATGREPALAEIAALREAFPEAALLVGSGLSEANAGLLLAAADGAIVGTAVKLGGVTTARVDPARAAALAARVATL